MKTQRLNVPPLPIPNPQNSNGNKKRHVPVGKRCWEESGRDKSFKDELEKMLNRY